MLGYLTGMTDEISWYAEIVTPALLRHARTTYGKAMRAALEAAGYDDIPGNGLYIIGGLAAAAGGVPISQLMRELGITKQGAGQLVDTLVARGYLQRTPDENDRRRLIVTLTERGQAAAETQSAAREEIDAALLARVGEVDVAAARRMLAALIEIHREAQQTEAANEPLSPVKASRRWTMGQRIEKQRLDGTEFNDCSMAEVTFDNVNLRDARFHDVNLAGATLDDVNLKNLTITNANIEGLTIYGYDIHELLQPLLERDDKAETR
jgi:DNA-binding MarR family transcriptional regulator